MLAHLIAQLHLATQIRQRDEDSRVHCLVFHLNNHIAGVTLCREHPEILAAVRTLIDRVRSGSPLPTGAVERDVAAIFERLNTHDAGENELIRDILAVDAGSVRRSRETRSKALEVNLRRTAVDVVIPEEQKVLLEVTADFAGVSENTKKYLCRLQKFLHGGDVCTGYRRQLRE